jgi:hypothetical protein
MQVLCTYKLYNYVYLQITQVVFTIYFKSSVYLRIIPGACAYKLYNWCVLTNHTSRVCLQIQQFLKKRVLCRVRSSAFSISSQISLVFLRSFSSCLRLLPRISVAPFLLSKLYSITCFKGQFLRKM